jgi:hypothetical protein
MRYSRLFLFLHTVVYCGACCGAEDKHPASPELKWAKSIATDFLDLVAEGDRSQAAGLLSPELHQAIGGNRDFFAELVDLWSDSHGRQRVFKSEELAPDKSEAVFTGTFSKDGNITANFTVRVAKEGGGGKWSVRMFKWRQVDNEPEILVPIEAPRLLSRAVDPSNSSKKKSEPEDTLYFTSAAFRIPFTVPPGAPEYQAKLYLSRDQGLSWKCIAAAKSKEREFTYISKDGDGSYWFAVQTITPEGIAIPPEIVGNNNDQVLRIIVRSKVPAQRETKSK